MADKEQVQNQKDLNAKLDRTKESLREILFEQRNLADESRAFAKKLFESSAQATATSRAFRGLANVSREINSQLEGIIRGEEDFETLQKKINKLKNEERLFNVELEQALSKAGFDQKEINDVLTGQVKILDLVENSGKNISNEAFDLLTLYNEQAQALKDQNDDLEEIAGRAKVINEGTGITGTIFGGADEFLDKIGGGKIGKALGLGEAADEGRKLSAELTKGGTKVASAGDKTKIMGRMLGTVAKNLMKAFGPLAILVELFKGIMEADKQIVQLQKNTLATREQAAGFRAELGRAAASSNNLNITGTKLLETFNSINDTLGFINSFSNDTLVSTTKLVKQVGLQQETANALAALSERQGESTEDNFENVVGTTLEMQKQSGIQITQQKIFDTIAKTTGIIRANLGSNPVEIGKAVQAAAEFGAELEQVAAAGEALLNFEQSIEKELQAELLLGRDINLERARAAALSGDQVTLAQELQKQAGGFADFSAMNVIQQQALAESLGMQADELADILYKQDLQTKGAENIRAELAATGQEDAIRALEAQSAQDKLNASFDKLKDLFVDLGVAFSPVLELLIKTLNIIGPIAAFVGDIVSGISRIIRFIGGDGGAFDDFRFFGGTGDSLANSFGIADDMNMNIPAGYGETIIKRPKGSLALNNNDSVNITAGTNLNQNQGNSMAGLERKFDVLIAATKANKMEASSFYATA